MSFNRPILLLTILVFKTFVILFLNLFLILFLLLTMFSISVIRTS